MQAGLTLSLSVEELASGSPVERATFGLFSVCANERLLSAGQDIETGELRHGPYVAGYPLAEWFAWNWWRIRSEIGRPTKPDARHRWEFSHRMATVGDGYAWPDIRIFSDGPHSFLEAEPSQFPGTAPFRYIGSPRRQTVSTVELEAAIDGFIENMLDRLDGCGIRDTNLHRLWNDLGAEREDLESAKFRCLEAQLGCDPDELDEDAVRAHLRDAELIGEGALGEIAGDAAVHGHHQGQMLSAREVSDVAQRSGFDADMNDAVRLTDAAVLPTPGDVPAWRIGTGAARLLREQLNLDGQPICNHRLAELVGTTVGAISDTHRRSSAIPFVLDLHGGRGRVALRSKWDTGRRFELARLLGDRVVECRMPYSGERLSPATRIYSYRQKMQRAFAAEFLSPFAEMDGMLEDDYDSEEAQVDVAQHFAVSPWTVRTQLLNHGCIDREDAPDIAVRGAEQG